MATGSGPARALTSRLENGKGGGSRWPVVLRHYLRTRARSKLARRVAGLAQGASAAWAMPRAS